MLQAIALAIGYPGHPVGSGFDLDLQPGTVLALLGPCLLYTSPSPRD